ncbi:MAG: EAL domain-containing protein [Thermoanaerobaculia bacterium]
MSAFEIDYRSVYERSMAGVFSQTVDGRLLDCNEACAQILGYESRDELMGEGSFTYCNSSDQTMMLSALRDLGTLPNLEICLRRKDGTLAWVYGNVHLRTVEPEGQEVVDGVLLEVTDQRQQAERVEFQLQHDPLTELPNRALFIDRLNVALARARRQKRLVAVLYVDLDHFGLLSATFGGDNADRILKGLSLRLTEALRMEDSVARHGSDEFMFLLTDFGSAENSAIIAQRILDTISRPFVIEDRQVFVNASIGIALFPEDGTEAEALIDNAANAMYRAKEAGRNTYQLYEPSMNARAFERSFLISNLRKAVDMGEFSLHYQPQVNIQNGRIECIEALLRWNHPLYGAVEPGTFLVAAEEARLTLPIGDWVLREASRQIASWSRAGMIGNRISVNLSVGQLRDPALKRNVQRILDETGIEPSSLELELSDATLHDYDRAAVAIRSLKDLGVQIAIDDFGTGCTSFNDFKRIPIDTIKIDSTFTRNAPRDPKDAAIIDAMILMARSLGLRVVAEGVETKEQMAFLRDHRCLDMQGFFFGRPAPAAILEPTLRLQH